MIGLRWVMIISMIGTSYLLLCPEQKPLQHKRKHERRTTSSVNGKRKLSIPLCRHTPSGGKSPIDKHVYNRLIRFASKTSNKRCSTVEQMCDSHLSWQDMCT